jgi:hypothetical protein
MSVLTTSAAASALFGSSTSNWIGSAWTSTQSSLETADTGILGALESSGSSDISSVLANSAGAADMFASITATNTSNASNLYAQIAAQRIKKEQGDQLQKAMDDLARTQSMVQPTNTLDQFIYFPDGSNIDTRNNIMTMANGDQFDTTTGAKYVDPSQIMNFPDGSWLDMKKNIMTLANGTQIDTVTGLTVNKAA